MKKALISLAVAVMAAVQVSASDFLTPNLQYNGKYGYVSPTGKLMIRARYDQAMPFREGMAAVMVDGRWGYINEQGRTVVKLQYESANDFNGGYGIVRKNGLWGAVNREGELEIPCEYPNLSDLLSLKVFRLTPEQAAKLKNELEKK